MLQNKTLFYNICDFSAHIFHSDDQRGFSKINSIANKKGLCSLFIYRPWSQVVRQVPNLAI